MNEHEKTLLATVMACVFVALLVGLATPEYREASAIAGILLLAAPFLWSDKIYGWLDGQAGKSTSFGWYIFWVCLSLPFAIAMVIFTGTVPERSS